MSPQPATVRDKDPEAEDSALDPTPTGGDAPGGAQEEWEVVHEDETQDDAVIGRALAISLKVMLGFALAFGLIWFLRSVEPPPPEVQIEAEAPEAVVEAGAAPTVRFTDMAAAAGVDFVHANGEYGDKLLPETMGGGVAVFDADGDGDSDLLFVDSGRWNHRPEGEEQLALRLYRNDTAPGSADWRFTDVTRGSGLDALDPASLYGMGVAVGDVDGDADLDLFITGVGQNRLYENDGSASFEDITAQAGVGGEAEEWSTSAGFFDIDADGDLDLMVCNYVRWSKEIDFELDFRLTGIGRAFGPPQSYGGTFPYLYRNEGVDDSGRTRFVDITAEAGLKVENPATGAPMAKSLALAPTDVDGDGYLDVLVANDTVQNFFFHNQGGTFEEMGELVGLAYDRDGNATGAMGVDVGHYRNDASLGFLIGNFANEMSSVYVSQDDPLFYVDEAIADGIGAPSRRMLTFGLFLFDVDLDGRLDLFQANGHVESDIHVVDPSQSHAQPSQIFWNAGDRGFEALDLATSGDLARDVVGRGAAYADLDQDGDLDIVMTQIGLPPLLLRNEQDLGHHWLRLRLADAGPNTGAVGAWVEVTSGGAVQRRQVMPVRSYLSQVEPELTFGLGARDGVEAVKVIWPDGEEQELGALAIDQLHVIRRSS